MLRERMRMKKEEKEVVVFDERRGRYEKGNGATQIMKETYKETERERKREKKEREKRVRMD